MKKICAFSAVLLLAVVTSTGFAGDKQAGLPAALPETIPAETAKDSIPAGPTEASPCRSRCAGIRSKCAKTSEKCNDCLHRLCEFVTYREQLQPCDSCCKRCSADCYPQLYVFFLDQCGKNPTAGGPGGPVCTASQKCHTPARCHPLLAAKAKFDLHGVFSRKPCTDGSSTAGAPAPATGAPSSQPAEIQSCSGACEPCAQPRFDLRNLFHRTPSPKDCSACEVPASSPATVVTPKDQQTIGVPGVVIEMLPEAPKK
jgi:hypothetical protein